MKYVSGKRPHIITFYYTNTGHERKDIFKVLCFCIPIIYDTQEVFTRYNSYQVHATHYIILEENLVTDIVMRSVLFCILSKMVENLHKAISSHFT